MPITEQSPDTDLWLPLRKGEDIDPHTIHTHYFGFAVPEAELAGFIYIRYQPAFPLAQGGVVIFRGLDNVELLDVEYFDWQNTMRWPTVEGNVITTSHGLRIEFVELGKHVRLSYESTDGTASFEFEQHAITPMFARAHVMPGEAENADMASQPGGSEQYMHCTGKLTLRGEQFDVDCVAPRDRSWNQVRTERRGAVEMPPIAWTPMYFGEDLAFNQIGMEAPDTSPPYLEAYKVDPSRPSHVYGWVYVDGEMRELASVRREVHERHPITHCAIRMDIDAEDETGRTYSFKGEAVALATLPAWPNLAFHDALFRWENEDGRISHATCQEAWFDKYQRLMNERTGRAARAGR